MFVPTLIDTICLQRALKKKKAQCNLFTVSCCLTAAVSCDEGRFWHGLCSLSVLTLTKVNKKYRKRSGGFPTYHLKCAVCPQCQMVCLGIYFFNIYFSSKTEDGKLTATVKWLLFTFHNLFMRVCLWLWLMRLFDASRECQSPVC